MRHAAATRHGGNGAGDLLRIDGALEQLIDPLQPLALQADVLGFARGERGGGERQGEQGNLETRGESGHSGGFFP